MPFASVFHWAILLIVSLSFHSILIDAINTQYNEVSLDANVSSAPGLTKLPRIEPSEGRVLIKFKNNSGQQKRSEVLARNGLTEIGEISNIGVKILRTSDEDTSNEVVLRLLAKEKSDIEYAEVDELVPAELFPNDPYFGSSWHLNKMSLPSAWDKTTGSNDVIVAVLDTGVDPNHPDLTGKLVPGWNFYDNNSNTSDVNGHGTKVAGSSAVGNNGTGVSGVSWSTKIMPIRVADASAYAYYSAIANGITYAANNGAKVATASFAGASESSTIQNAAQYMDSKGGVVMIAAGNDGVSSTQLDNKYVVRVSATDSNDIKTSWSSYGTNIDLAAPGVGIYTTTMGGGYGAFSGTSYSSPLAASVAALVYSINKNLTPTQVREILFRSADDLGVVGWDPLYGHGRVNADKAVTLASQYTSSAPISDTNAPTTPTNLSASAISSSQISLQWNASNDDTSIAGYKLYRNGSLVATLQGTKTSHTDNSLSASTSYTYEIQAYDSAGNTSGKSAPSSAMTMAESSALSITNYSVTTKTSNSATITWNTNVPTTGIVSYGTTSSLGSQMIDNNLSTTHSVSISGLTSGAKYYYRITATDSGGKTVTTNVSTFKTSGGTTQTGGGRKR